MSNHLHFKENPVIGFLIHFEKNGCNFVKTIENDDRTALFSAITHILNENVAEIYIERATFEKEHV